MERLAQEKAAAQAAVQRLEAGAAAAAKAFDAEQARPPATWRGWPAAACACRAAVLRAATERLPGDAGAPARLSRLPA